MSLLRELLELGVNLVNKEVDLKPFFNQYITEGSRSMMLVISDSQGQSRFGLCADKVAFSIKVVEPHTISSPTVEVTVPEDLGFYVACGVETILTSFLKGYPIEIRGPFSIRDAKLIDKLLSLINEALEKNGKDLCQLLFGKSRSEVIKERTYGHAS